MNISYNDVKLYKQCPLQYRWYKFGGAPAEAKDKNEIKQRTFIGHLLNDLVGLFYKKQWWRQPKEVLPRFRIAVNQVAQLITDKEKIVWLPNVKETWIQVAQDTIPKIITVIKKEKLIAPDTNGGTYVELQTKYGYRNHEIFGRLDLLLDKSRDELILLDGKGGSTFGRYTDKDQLVFYSLATVNDPKFQRRPSRIGFWWFRHEKIQWLKLTENRINEFLMSSLRTIEGISQLRFDPTPSSHCRICDYRLGCEAGRKYLASKETQIPDLNMVENSTTVSL